MHKDILIFLDNKMYRIVEHLNIRVLEYSGNGNIILISRVYNNTPILITPLSILRQLLKLSALLPIIYLSPSNKNINRSRKQRIKNEPRKNDISLCKYLPAGNIDLFSETTRESLAPSRFSRPNRTLPFSRPWPGNICFANKSFYSIVARLPLFHRSYQK